ncbi:3-oxoacyl-ACP reductase FabG [Clostridium magnum]|uniref:3-oxoacyl-[acyl-carrier-protein] reductase FabG n=1 Tax=Clostridium magnum DSM 2767 TaxID=1121326 RepID=A0A161YIH9_9CLOT|nr:3-oxoacyl-ACP reductase FabG [Clostridium magnum]KZL90162.1 3-oxoacyl-[acyl-carrier-protein] reductase FabG [Clostridium magnum DSM 2767]SHH62802.1 2-hydroxycyclohexanecarboxyl-CoA dehydrogenase [Clostridium magnum DSM 2767]
MRLENKVAIVTGAGRGLGKGIAMKLAAEGAKVVIADISLNIANETVKEILDLGGTSEAFAVNVSKQEEVKALFDFTIEKFGTLDIMVNNAGINRDAMLHKMTIEQWDQVIAVNLSGTFYCTQHAAQILREKGKGSIINIASASWLGNVGQANYAASKAGVVGLTKTASRELAKKGVTCNAICPGFIETDMTRGVPEKVWDIMVNKIPMGRAGKPSDVANMVAFLASDEADYVTGEVINVGGGMIL